MLDILKGLTGKIWLPLFAWVFPSVLAVLAFWFFISPLMEQWPVGIADQMEKITTTATGIWLSGVAVIIGGLLYVLSTPLYRLLEGYSWPKSIRQCGVKRHKRKFETLRKKVETLSAKIEAGVPEQQWELGLLQERLSRYPTDIKQIAPTLLGNALRSFETYGSDRFYLDSQLLWTELRSVVPEQLSSETDSTRCMVDFFIAVIYLCLALALIALGVICWNWMHEYKYDPMYWLMVVVPLALTIPAYRMGIVATSSWSASVQALVNLGRKPLAQSLGLKLPKTLSDERDMWAYVVSFVFGGNKDDGTGFDKFRD